MLLRVDTASKGAHDDLVQAGWRMHSSQKVEQGPAFRSGEAHQPLRLELPGERQPLMESLFARGGQFQRTDTTVIGCDHFGEQPTFDETAQVGYQITLIDPEKLTDCDLADPWIRRDDGKDSQLPSWKAAGGPGSRSKYERGALHMKAEHRIDRSESPQARFFLRRFPTIS
jgi:hypothetical protein